MGLLVIFDRKRKNEGEIERQVVRGERGTKENRQELANLQAGIKENS